MSHCPHCGQTLPAPPRPVTFAQQRTLAAIVALTLNHGYPPTVREICDHLGLYSSASVHANLVKLRDAGWVAWEPKRSRSLRVVGQSETPAG